MRYSERSPTVKKLLGRPVFNSYIRRSCNVDYRWVISFIILIASAISFHNSFHSTLKQLGILAAELTDIKERNVVSLDDERLR